ncbi:unnamed protein product [Sphagnum jensenii]|uniref:N-acylneuraminate-9-phosphatase n=1 Tax=Sphagnum jensenii TaxID=128206 RepID=A0ABP0XAU5_9BRYO
MGALLFPATSQQLHSLHKFWSQPISPSPPVFPATQFLIPQKPTHFSSATSRLFCVRSVHRTDPPFSGRLRGTRHLPEFEREFVVMATTTAASPMPGSLEILEETVQIAATLENGSLPSGGRNLEAVFFDLDDTLVLTHAADTVAYKAVQALVQQRIPLMNGDEMLKVFIAKFDVQPWDLTHQVEVTEWRARIWGEALKSQGVEDMELARDMQHCFDEERMLSFQWVPGVEAMVRSLHAQGIKVGIITNGHFSVQRTKLKACKADQLFDMILVGGEEPNQKPHKDIFLKACKLTGSKPENSIMVGDNLKTDIQGAQNAGFLATVWVNVHNLEGPPAGGPVPHHIIPNIGELPGVLEEFGALSENPPKTSTM